MYHLKKKEERNRYQNFKRQTSNFKLPTIPDRDPIKFFEIPNKIPRRTPVNITVTIDSTLRIIEHRSSES